MITKFPWIFTFGWLVFCVLWALRSFVVRRGKKYVKDKKLIDTNIRYKLVSQLVYALQISLIPIMFWSNSEILFKFHNNDSLRLFGLTLCFGGLALSVSALIYLGRNYSPCYHSHEPFQLVTNGPYRWIRHPGWLSKIMVGLGGFLVSGSWWFAPILFWLWIEMKRTIQIEEESLAKTFQHYPEYRARTFFIIPYLY